MGGRPYNYAHLIKQNGVKGSLPCLGPRADLGGNISGAPYLARKRPSFDKAFSAAETFFEPAIRGWFEPRGYIVHAEYSYAGNMREGFRARDIVYHAGKDPLVAEIHAALVSDRKVKQNGRLGNPKIGKADFLIIPAKGKRGNGLRQCGVIEVGPRSQKGAKIRQISQRVRSLQMAMYRAKWKHGTCEGVFWRAEPWKPRWLPGHRTSAEFGPNRLYICAEPTWRDKPPHGVLLYEVHSARIPEPDLVPVRVPQEQYHHLVQRILKRIKAIYPDKDPLIPINEENPRQLARKLFFDPGIRREVKRRLEIDTFDFVIGAILVGLTVVLAIKLGTVLAPLLAMITALVSFAS